MGAVPNPKNAIKIAPSIGVVVADAPAKAIYTKPQGKSPFNSPKITNPKEDLMGKTFLKVAINKWVIF